MVTNFIEVQYQSTWVHILSVFKQSVQGYSDQLYTVQGTIPLLVFSASWCSSSLFCILKRPATTHLPFIHRSYEGLICVLLDKSTCQMNKCSCGVMRKGTLKETLLLNWFSSWWSLEVSLCTIFKFVFIFTDAKFIRYSLQAVVLLLGYLRLKGHQADPTLNEVRAGRTENPVYQLPEVWLSLLEPSLYFPLMKVPRHHFSYRIGY